ncbi:hypothetical protein LMG19089_03144 [Ralstonia edaphis]|jgi:hypothetical protein|uniref:Uncharacterized protein n=1 Tax=Ralstonia pickettii OR214 TaxID=1264675 RepID=R0CIN2_RALPI|nr:hypothetical protein OR214_03380 [Ralstonia pickettii OR214]CAJ0702640.1 hypothetical protein LMG19089_03144 [Ralstonia sp. LMG 6871]
MRMVAHVASALAGGSSRRPMDCPNGVVNPGQPRLYAIGALA